MKKVRKHLQSKLKLSSRLDMSDDSNLLDICQKQFFKQQKQIIDLQYHLRNFIRDVTRITDSIDNLYSCFKGIYEPNWVGSVDFNSICQDSVRTWRQFISDFKYNVSRPIEDYSQDFPEMNRSIEKRNKKLNELNKQRQTFENYRNSKKIDEVKLKKTEMDMKLVEQEFKSLNSSLSISLPNFCDKRITVFVDLWTKLTKAEQATIVLLNEGCNNRLKILSMLSQMATSDEYSIKSQAFLNFGSRGTLSTKTYVQSLMSLEEPRSPGTLSAAGSFIYGSYGNLSYSNNAPSTVTPNTDDLKYSRAQSYQVKSKYPLVENHCYSTVFSNLREHTASLSKLNDIDTNDSPQIYNANQQLDDNKNVNMITPPLAVTSEDSDLDNYDSDINPYAKIKKNDKTMKIKTQNSTEKPKYSAKRSSNVYDSANDVSYYYQVMVTHDYKAVNEDELTLKRNDILLVLPWNSKSEMEDGWIYGENVLTKTKGLFPENHTKNMDC